MKKIPLKILPAFFLSLALFGCKNAPKEIRTEHMKHSFQEAYKSEAPDSVAAEFDVEYIVEGFNKEALDSMNTAICSFLCGSRQYSDLSGAVPSLCAKLAENYRKGVEELQKDLDQEAIANQRSYGAYNWTYDYEGKVGKVFDGILPYKFTVTSYEGGMHGYSGDYCILLSSDSGKIIKEEDFFVDGYKDRLGSMILSSIKDSGRLEDLFNHDSVEPNGNFYVESGEITYIYNPYEIAPYASGKIEVKLPWKTVEPILRNEFKPEETK